MTEFYGATPAILGQKPASGQEAGSQLAPMREDTPYPPYRAGVSSRFQNGTKSQFQARVLFALAVNLLFSMTLARSTV
jgi:hypothetical protein